MGRAKGKRQISEARKQQTGFIDGDVGEQDELCLTSGGKEDMILVVVHMGPVTYYNAKCNVCNHMLPIENEDDPMPEHWIRKA